MTIAQAVDRRVARITVRVRVEIMGCPVGVA